MSTRRWRWCARSSAASPNVRAGRPDSSGALYSSLGHYETAIELLKQAVALREGQAGPGRASVAQALEWLGQVEIYAGRYDQAEAIRAARWRCVRPRVV